jgi:hypothetical protein
LVDFGEFVISQPPADRVIASGPRSFTKLFDRKIRAADLTHFASAHQRSQCAERIRNRRLRIGFVELVKIDAIGAEATQTLFGGLANIVRLRSLPLLIHLEAKLRGDERFIASETKGAPKEFLALPFALNVSGIEEVDAGLKRRVDNCRRRFWVDPPSEIITAQSDNGDVKRSDLACFHDLEFFASGGLRHDVTHLCHMM